MQNSDVIIIIIMKIYKCVSFVTPYNYKIYKSSFDYVRDLHVGLIPKLVGE